SLASGGPGAGGGGGGGGTGTGGNGTGNNGLTSKDSGCGCTLGTAVPNDSGWIAMLLVAGALILRRRRAGSLD
ncbi:MAG: hypothetical protein JWN44_4641, partial [Myxococcales bacterium]|nr:hypothetical protein [Myxococcales bacterium]